MLEYSIRVGTDNPGFDYEKEVAALLAIRYAFEDSVQDFWIAVNSNGIGDTDDVALCITPSQGEKFAFLIQLKHEESIGQVKYFDTSDFTYAIKDGRKRNKNKEKFSIDKYCRGYNKFKSNLQNFCKEQPEIIQDLRKVNRFSYFLYTNKELTKELSCLVKFESDDIILNHLNTATSSAIYKFKIEDFKTLKSFNEDFLQNLYLLPNQTNIKGVVKLIKAEIKKFFGSRKARVIDRYLDIIKLWTKGCEFQNGIKYNTLYKRDVVNILSDILLDNYKFNIEKNRFSCYDCPRCLDCPQKKIWNKLVLFKDVTLVNGNRLTRRFLRDYIGSEIKLKIKKQGEYWNTELDKFSSNVFKDQILNHCIQILKLCNRNDNNSITMAGVYKFLWFYEDLPLLLSISNQNEYNDILQILKMTKYKLKVIVITGNDQIVTYQNQKKVKHFSSLRDLDPLERDEILKLTVQFQGRCPVLLSDIITERMHPHLKCDDIIHILCDDFNVGNKFTFNYDKEGHIERSISKILISFEALANIENECFLVETKNEIEERKMVQKLKSDSKSEARKRICILNTNRIPKKIKELQATDKCFHRMLFHENFLEWIESTESVTSISKFQVIPQEYPREFLYDDVFTFLNSLDRNKLQIISSCSGMGKSALLNYISYYATFHVWIIPVILNDLVKIKDIKEKFIQFKEKEFFEFYARHILSADSSVKNLPLSLMVFEDMVKAKQVLILLDGFDEISISHKDSFSKLLKFFQTEKYSSVITTREHMKLFLETEFNILSRNLKSFTSDEQEHFLTHYFISKLCNKNVSVRNPDLYAILLDFVEKLLNASQRNLGNQDEHFTEIPLHLKLLANYFRKDCQSSLNKEVVSLSTNFNLLDLVEKFVKDKTHILCEKYGENEEVWAESLEDDQYLFALEYLFEKEYLIELNIASSLKKYYEVKKRSSQLIQRDGILISRPMQDDKIYIDFVHRIFAEYLAAQWLTENIQNADIKTTIAVLLKLRFEKAEHFQILFGMFDRLLAKTCMVHSNIINMKMYDLKLQLVTNPSVWFETDKMNRTAFHILSVYAKNYTIKDLTSILDTTPLNNLELNILDDFGYSVQDYAFLSGSWNLVTILCKLCPNFIRTGYDGLEKYCILKRLLGLMEFKNRWFVLKCVDGIKEEFPINTREIRPVGLILRVLSQFLKKASSFEFNEEYCKGIALTMMKVSRCLRKPSLRFGNIDLENLSAENLVLVEMEYKFNGEYCGSEDQQHLFDVLLEAESALKTAKDTGSRAFLEVYSGNLHSDNLRREGTLDADMMNNAMQKKSFELVHAQWLLLRRSTSEYPTREGTDNPGLDYEKEIAALFALRYTFEESVQDFWIATNVDCVGDTDDVVLCITPANEEPLAFLFQLKHENPIGEGKSFKDTDFTYLMNQERRDKRKERFSVDKYFQGYNRFQSHLKDFEQQSELIRHLQKVNKFAYILYTNRKMEEKLKCLVNTSQTVIFNHLNTSKTAFYKFQPEDFDLDSDFLHNLYLYPNQVSFEGVFNLIKSEIRKLFGSHKFARIDFDDVTKRYLEIIKLWTKGCEFEKGTKYITLSKINVINILSDILLESYKYYIEEYEFSCYDCRQKNIWNSLMLVNDISIVNGDDVTLQFLKDYVGREVKLKTKKQGKYWKAEVAKFASNAFCEPIPDEQVQVMKICSDAKNSSITLASIYKLMWFYNSLPLLLEINEEKEYNDILKILKLSKYKLRVIVITSDPDLNCRKIKQVKQFSSLKDLPPPERAEILKLSVQFQGRISIPLSEIAKENMLQNLKCADIIHILCNSFNIGNKFEFNCKCYIPKNVSKILISFEALAKIENEFFLIEAQDKTQCENFLINELSSYGFQISEDSQICILESDNLPTKIEELKTMHDCFHVLLFHENFLEWKESTGSVENIIKFQADNSTETLHDDVSCFSNSVDTNKFQIISACPGMGKSVLLNYITCFSTSRVWILSVILRNIAENEEIEEEPSEFFTYYMEQLLSEDTTVQNIAFSMVVFKDMVKAQQIFLLLDGFDEVSILYKDKFANLLRFFQEEKYPVLLTTREHMKPFLENKFNVPSRSLKPFTFQEQQVFLISFFKLNLTIKTENSNLVLLEFVQQLLKACKRNLSDRDEQFTGIPLQLQLLANNFLKECKISVNTQKVCLNTKFDLLDLYEKFIKNKTAILCEKYGASEKQWLKSLESIQYLLALQYLFNKQYLVPLNIQNYLDEYYQEKDYKSQLMQKEGILIFKSVKDKMAVDFIHRTFAEYLSAQWLTKNLQNLKFRETVIRLVQLRFEEEHLYKFLFVIFDRILAKRCTFHLDIINVRVNDIKAKLKSNPKIFIETDETNRTAFHLLGLYAHDYKEEDLNAIVNGNLFKDFELGTLDNLISYSALDYALLARSWHFANKLCELSPYLGIKNYEINYVSIENLNLKYKSLYLTVFHNILCRDLLAAHIDEQTEIYNFSKEIAKYYFLPNNLYSLLQNVSTVEEYLKLCKIKDISKNYYYDVRFAVAFGPKENIENLLSAKEVNIDEKDVNNGNTLLHYATIHKRDDIAEILLSKGASVNLAGRLEATVLHYAASGGYNNLLKMYMARKADLNLTNFRSQTSLDVAIEMQHFDVARTLLQQNSVITKSRYLLHNVVKVGDIELLEQFLKRGHDINEQMYNKETPLHIALRTNRADIAKILINHSCHYQSDTSQNSLLHLAAKIGDLELLNLFLKAGLDFDKRNKMLETPLMIAIENKHFQFAHTLIYNNANVHAKSKFSDVFSMAISSGNGKLISELIFKGCDVNRRNSSGHTYLLSAVKSGDLATVKALLQYADLNVQNKFGFTALHYAAMRGYQDLVVELLGYGVDMNKVTMDSDTALLLAFKHTFTQIAKLLILGKADVNVVNKEKLYALHYAVMFGDISIVQDLLVAGVKLNLQNNKGYTPLHLAISKHKTDIAKLLLSHNADIAVKTQEGNSTLHLAALAYNEEIVTECLKKKCDINELGYLGQTPLLCAMQYAKPEIANLLIANGADITIKNDFLQSALHRAAERGLDDLVLYFLNNGFDINERNMFGQTPLALALKNSNLSTAKLLYLKGATIDIEIADRSTTLHLAAYCGYKELVMECINKGSDINKSNLDDLLPIDVAIDGNKFDVVKILIENETIPSIYTIRSYLRMKIETDLDVAEKTKFFKLLLRKFNNINTQDNTGNSILHYVCISSELKNNSKAEFNRVQAFDRQVVEILLHLGADFKMENNNYKSAYDLVVQNNKTSILEIFDQHSSENF